MGSTADIATPVSLITGASRGIGAAVARGFVARGGKVVIAKINIDENPDAPGKYGVRGIPTMILFDKGQSLEERIVAEQFVTA